jgi:hypothetical protein
MAQRAASSFRLRSMGAQTVVDTEEETLGDIHKPRWRRLDLSLEGCNAVDLNMHLRDGFGQFAEGECP